MKAYFALGGLLITLLFCVWLQSERLKKANIENGKLEQTIEQREREYDAIKEAADNQILARDAAVKRYKLSVEQSQRANKKLAKALDDAKRDDETFNTCMRIIVSDAVFNELPQ